MRYKLVPNNGLEKRPSSLQDDLVVIRTALVCARAAIAETSPVMAAMERISEELRTRTPMDAVQQAAELGGIAVHRLSGWCIDTNERFGIASNHTQHPRRLFWDARFATEMDAARNWVEFCYGRPYELA